MKKLLQKIPIPICGLILGMASLGNLLKSEGWFLVGNTLGIIAMGIMMLVFSKLVWLFRETYLHLKDPIIASVAPTFTMSLMVICTYLIQLPSLATVVRFIWLLTVLLHFSLMVFFIYEFIIKKEVQIEHVYPSWFIVFVGIGVISVSCGDFYPELGRIIFWIALGFYLLLLPIVLHRILIFGQIEAPTLPLLTIIAAPGSLCLTGYLKAFSNPNILLAISLLVLSQGLYFLVLKMIIPLRKLPFYPSYAAFTFPLVISATALTEFNHFLPLTRSIKNLLVGIQWLETGIALLVVGYVFLHYLKFLSFSGEKENSISEIKQLT